MMQESYWTTIIIIIIIILAKYWTSTFTFFFFFFFGAKNTELVLENWDSLDVENNISKNTLCLDTAYFVETKKLGMVTGRVRAGFFHTRTQPAGQDPWPGPAPFRVPGFFPGPRPAPARARGARGPRLEIGPNLWPNQKKKKKPHICGLFVPLTYIFALK